MNLRVVLIRIVCQRGVGGDPASDGARTAERCLIRHGFFICLVLERAACVFFLQPQNLRLAASDINGLKRKTREVEVKIIQHLAFCVRIAMAL